MQAAFCALWRNMLLASLASTAAASSDCAAEAGSTECVHQQESVEGMSMSLLQHANQMEMMKSSAKKGSVYGGTGTNSGSTEGANHGTNLQMQPGAASDMCETAKAYPPGSDAHWVGEKDSASACAAACANEGAQYVGYTYWPECKTAPSCGCRCVTSAASLQDTTWASISGALACDLCSYACNYSDHHCDTCQSVERSGTTFTSLADGVLGWATPTTTSATFKGFCFTPEQTDKVIQVSFIDKLGNDRVQTTVSDYQLGEEVCFLGGQSCCSNNGYGAMFVSGVKKSWKSYGYDTSVCEDPINKWYACRLMNYIASFKIILEQGAAVSNFTETSMSSSAAWR